MRKHQALLLFLGGIALLAMLGGEKMDLPLTFLFLLLTAIAAGVAVRNSEAMLFPLCTGQPLILTAGLSPLPALTLEIFLLGLVLGISGMLVQRGEGIAYGAAGGISFLFGAILLSLPNLVFRGIALLLASALVACFLLFSRERFWIQCQGAG